MWILLGCGGSFVEIDGVRTQVTLSYGEGDCLNFSMRFVEDDGYFFARVNDQETALRDAPSRTSFDANEIVAGLDFGEVGGDFFPSSGGYRCKWDGAIGTNI